MQHKTITSERGTIHYWIKKSEKSLADCIVFSHGLTADHTLFDKQIDFWSKHYTVIT